jgi:hypothetical protein
MLFLFLRKILLRISYSPLNTFILDYGCAVWHTRLPSFLVEKIERIQKRIIRVVLFRIIFPHLSYREALALILYAQDLKTTVKCLKLFNKLQTQPSSKHLPLIDDSPYYVFLALCIVVIVVSLIFKMVYFLS